MEGEIGGADEVAAAAAVAAAACSLDSALSSLRRALRVSRDRSAAAARIRFLLWDRERERVLTLDGCSSWSYFQVLRKLVSVILK